ncbi:hypothetical protein [Streptomyces sp. NPDC093105]|uniref:hypothetical protein n=1 Tax=Streptomyces sp. NPDC093105 TaxID=3366029 RepID=UPI003810F26F
MSDVEAEIRQRIRGLLVDLIGGKRFADGVPDSASLREAGLPSTGLVSLWTTTSSRRRRAPSPR